MQQMINVFFLQHRRNFIPMLEYFANRIKPENKSKLRFYFLTTYDIPIQFNTGIEYVVKHFGGDIHTGNYRDKFMWATAQDGEYFFKLDEDIIFSNHVWDYIIENCEIVKAKSIMTLSPTINIGVPTIDLFIESFCPELREQIEEMFLGVNLQETAGNRWGMDLEHLNDFTIRAPKWDRESFHNRLIGMQTNIKGIHPCRFSREIQYFMMDVVLKNVYKFISKQNFELTTINCPYLVNDLCLYHIDKIRQVQKDLGFDPYDEIPMNKWAFDRQLQHVYIRGAYSLHSYYAFVSTGQLFPDYEQYIHNTILEKSKEIHHFDLV